MKYFSVPADYNTKTIDGYYELNCKYEDSKVIETYGQITEGSVCGSGRDISSLPKINLYDLEQYIKYSRERGIDFHYTLNSANMRNEELTEEGYREIVKFLKELYRIGVRSLTVAMPSLLEIVKSTGLDFKIRSSAICSINNVNKAMMYKKLDVHRIVTEEAINRDFDTLKRIRENYGPDVEVIVNSVCHKDCIYRMFHYNQIAADSIKVVSKASQNYFNYRCMRRRYENMGSIFRLTWIRPEDIKYYTEIGIEYFKIQGRQNVVFGDPVKAIECYFKESYDGNLMELLELFSNENPFNVYVDNKKLDDFIKPFVNKKDFCKRDCTQCKYCDSFAEKVLDKEKTENVMDLAKEFYIENDEFKAYQKRNSEMEENLQLESMLSCDFDF